MKKTSSMDEAIYQISLMPLEGEHETADTIILKCRLLKSSRLELSVMCRITLYEFLKYV